MTARSAQGSNFERPSTTMRLGRSDLVVSKIGVGAAAWGRDILVNVSGSTDAPEEEVAAFQSSVAAGVTLFDTSAQYKAGNSERRLGELATGSKALIATKYEPSLGHLPWPTPSRNLPVALDRSLGRLQRQVIDLYQVQQAPLINVSKVMHRAADAFENGKIRAIGVSAFTEQQLREAHAVLDRRGIPLASSQVHFSLLYRKPEFNGMLAACHELEITPIAYMPMAMGLLTGKYKPGNAPKDWVRRHIAAHFSDEALLAAAPVTELLTEIGERYNRTPGQVALRWVIERGAIPVPGAKNQKQALGNAEALTFSLTQDEVEQLADSARDWVQAPKWSFRPKPARS